MALRLTQYVWRATFYTSEVPLGGIRKLFVLANISINAKGPGLRGPRTDPQPRLLPHAVEIQRRRRAILLPHFAVCVAPFRRPDSKVHQGYRKSKDKADKEAQAPESDSN